MSASAGGSEGGAAIPEALRPIYQMHEPNQPVILFEGYASLDGYSVSSRSCQVRLDWTPSPELLCELELKRLSNLNLSDRGSLRPIAFDHSRLEGEARIASVNLSSSSGTQAIALVRRAESRRPSELGYLLFHVVNFPPFVGSRLQYVRQDGVELSVGRLSFEAGGWRTHLDQVHNLLGSGSLSDRLRASGGYAITHVGRIERVDGAPFSVEEAEALLEALTYFLSFARGAWVDPTLPVGFSPGGERAWEQWRIGRIDPINRQRDAPSWAPGLRPDALPQAWPGFFSLWEDHDWNKALRVGVHWYLESNNQISLETSLVLSQVALELLAWRVVYPTSGMGESAFDKRPAFEKIRSLLSDCGIPAQVPSGLHNLYARSGKVLQAWSDGPKALTELRNWIVHPTPNHLSRSLAENTDVRREVRTLGLWYLELVLLHVMRYKGPYQNRITPGWQGNYDYVPWAASPQAP